MSDSNFPGTLAIVDEEITNSEFNQAWHWLEGFSLGWRAAHPELAPKLDPRGFGIWAAVLYPKHRESDPRELAERIPFAPEFFERTFVMKGAAWIESFRASYMANEIDPEDVDDRGITLLWGPLMYVEHSDADPIDLAAKLAVEDGIPSEFMPLLFPTYIHCKGSSGPIPEGYVQDFPD